MVSVVPSSKRDGENGISKEGREGPPLTNVTIRGQAAAAAVIVVGMRALGVPFARDRLCSNSKEVCCTYHLR